MGDLRMSDLHPRRKKRHATYQHSIHGSNHAALEPRTGFEIRNRFVLRPSLWAIPRSGSSQFLDTECRSCRTSDAGQKLTHTCGPGSERRQRSLRRAGDAGNQLLHNCAGQEVLRKRK